MAEIIWGINPVLEVLKSDPQRLEEIVITKGELRGRLYQVLEKAKKAGVPVKIREKLPEHELPPQARTQGVIAYLKGFDYASLDELLARAKEREEPALLVAVDGITDPQNLGSLIRSSEAAGAHGLIIPKKRAASITGTVIKASAGAIAHLPICRVTNLGRTLEELKERGLWIAGLDARAESNIYQLDLTLPLVWVIGSEDRGLRPNIREKCDFLAAIPMRGRIDSLNAAVAGAIALFETLRQRFWSR
ncbi:MAG: 23S rRNA (guanosine(2251)-2'-O)-methyltransferase RlmB [Thermodesulfobacteria bacterium]|nr:23S rRNA (guanosine(2251)-2'-O)-methyltransferase RlmB [Thermodesulfobacteriota bacterium]